MIVHVRVEQKHIENGKRQLGDSCPIKLALEDANIPAEWVEIDIEFGEDSPVFEVGGEYYGLPEECLPFIESFDEHGPSAVQPFEFDLVLPENLVREISD